MAQKLIGSPLGVINPDSLKADEKYLFSVNYEMFPDETVSLFKKNDYLVVHFKFWDKIDKYWDMEQKEYPLKALSWIIDRFENGFFKSQDQGGTSDFERSMRKEFDGELIGINAMTHCCAENLPGFNIWNASRKSYISEVPPQQWDIPRYILLEQGLLEKLKALSNDFEEGRL